MRGVVLIGLLMTHSLAGVCAATALRTGAGADAAKYQAWISAAVAALELRNDANSLATAATLSMIGKDTRLQPDMAGAASAALDLSIRASTLAPDDAAIGWVRLRLCASSPGCDVRDAATTMRWLDPENAAAWLPTLAGAQKDKDRVEVDRVLLAMAQGKRFDFYWNRIVVFMSDSLKSVSKRLPAGYTRSDSARLAQISGIAGAEMIPPLAPLVEACREAALGTDRRDSCLRIARSAQQGDTIIAQMLGLGMERRMLPVDSRESRALGDRRRVLEWRLATASKFDTSLLPWRANAEARWRLARMRTSRREEDVVNAILRERGVTLDPPLP
jgi:hypothetical protein